MRHGSTTAKALAYLQEHAKCTRQELADHLSMSVGRVSVILAMLRYKGLVVHLAWGGWAVRETVERTTVEAAIATQPRRLVELQEATGLTRSEVVHTAIRLVDQGKAVKLGPYYVAPFDASGTGCPRHLEVQDCIESYTDAHCGIRKDHPCLGCIVGCARRLALGLGRAPTQEELEISFTENMS